MRTARRGSAAAHLGTCLHLLLRHTHSHAHSNSSNRKQVSHPPQGASVNCVPEGWQHAAAASVSRKCPASRVGSTAVGLSDCGTRDVQDHCVVPLLSHFLATVHVPRIQPTVTVSTTIHGAYDSLMRCSWRGRQCCARQWDTTR